MVCPIRKKNNNQLYSILIWLNFEKIIGKKFLNIIQQLKKFSDVSPQNYVIFQNFFIFMNSAKLYIYIYIYAE